MPRFSQRSRDNLNQCHPLLVQVAEESIKRYDFTVVCGHRGREAQEAAFRGGFSKAHFGQSPHNFTPSLAFDAYSYPINVNDETAAILLGEAMLDAADRLSINITWGGTFGDKPHFQLTNWKTLRNL